MIGRNKSYAKLESWSLRLELLRGKYSLGIEVNQPKKGIFTSQLRYVTNLLLQETERQFVKL